MNMHDSLLTAAIATLVVVAAAVLCALIAVAPAKAFAALADLPPDDRSRIYPRYPFNMFIYGWGILMLLPWIVSRSSESIAVIWDILAIVAAGLVILGLLIYISLWTRALFLQHISSDIRKGLPFFIGGAALIEIFLAYSFISSIRGT